MRLRATLLVKGAIKMTKMENSGERTSMPIANSNERKNNTFLQIFRNNVLRRLV